MASRTVAGVLAGILLTTSVQAFAQPPGPGMTPTPTIAADFVHRLPLGTRVRLRLSDGTTLNATLMASQDDAVIVKRRTRLAEPPIKIELTRIVDADVVHRSSLGKAIAVGVAAGAGAAVGVFALLVAIYAD